MSTGLEIIKLYPKQKELLKALIKNDRTIVLSARQCGKTTSYTIFCLWYATFFPDKKIMICANKLQTAIEIMGRIQKAYEYLPKFLKASVVVYNKSEIAFSNGSVIKGFATGSSSARGFSGNCVILDEFSFVQKNLASDFFASVMPIISSGKNSKAIIVSTPNGTDNLYYEIWKAANSKEASKNKEGWKPFRIDWWEAGGIRDEKWKEQQIATIGLQRWNQEFANEFLDSATSKKLIPDDIIEAFRMKITERKDSGKDRGKDLYVSSRDGKKTYVFRMWHEFSPDRTYLATFDVAEGIKKDSSVLYIWDVTETSNVTMCAAFSANDVSILEFAYVAREILKLYADPYVAGESNGISLGFIEQLRITYEYENFVMMGKDHGCGIDSHVCVKTKACLWCRDMMTTQGFGWTIYDPDLVEEMSTFIKKDTKVHDVYAAVGENHDDHMMCLVWAAWILHPENVGKYFDVKAEFKSSLGNVYPKFIAPMFRYTDAEIENVRSNQVCRDFALYAQKNDTLGYFGDEWKKFANPNDVVVPNRPVVIPALQVPEKGIVSPESVIGGKTGQGGDPGEGNGFFFGTGKDGGDLFGWDDDGPMW